MKKIRLDVAALEVKTFQTAGAPQGRGTVDGRQEIPYSTTCATNYCTPGEGSGTCFFSDLCETTVLPPI